MKLATCIFSDGDSSSGPETFGPTTYNGRAKKQYSYVCMDDNVVPGWFLVVMVDGLFKIVKVINVESLRENQALAYKTAMSGFDIDTYQKELQRQREAELIRSKLRAKKDLLVEADQFQQLAAIDPESAALFQQLQELTGAQTARVVHHQTDDSSTSNTMAHD